MTKQTPQRWKLKIDKAGNVVMPAYKRPLKPTEARKLGEALIAKAREAQLTAMGASIKKIFTVNALPLDDFYVEQVLETLLALPTRKHRMEYVAKVMKTSKRTLQRRLREAECSFEEVRDYLRSKDAIRLILHTKESIENISAQIGFRDRTALTQACKRWTDGYTPQELRSAFAKTKLPVSTT